MVVSSVSNYKTGDQAGDPLAAGVGVRGRLPSELSPAWVSQAREHRQGERQRQRLGAGEELGAVEER